MSSMDINPGISPISEYDDVPRSVGVPRAGGQGHLHQPQQLPGCSKKNATENTSSLLLYYTEDDDMTQCVGVPGAGGQ